MLNVLFIIFVCCISSIKGYEVVYAVNAGGEEFVDSNNIHYQADTSQTVGTASSFGSNVPIYRVPVSDAALYQTERFHTKSFHYDIPINGDGDYALVLKFSEVFFEAAEKKIFDVVLNSAHKVVENLDIFSQVGRGFAHDETIPFTISKGNLYYEDKVSKLKGDTVRVEFAKGAADNPKVNAIVLFKGDVDNIPKLQSLEEAYEQLLGILQEYIQTGDYDIKDIIHSFESKQQSEQISKKRRISGPKIGDPYELDDSTLMLPIIIAIVAFLPLVFCICRL